MVHIVRQVEVAFLIWVSQVAHAFLIQVIAEIMAFHLHRTMVLGMVVKLRAVSSVVALVQTLAAVAITSGLCVQAHDTLSMVHVLAVALFAAVVLRRVPMARVVLLSIHRWFRKTSYRDVVAGASRSLALWRLLLPNVLWSATSRRKPCLIPLQDHRGSLMRALLVRYLNS